MNADDSDLEDLLLRAGHRVYRLAGEPPEDASLRRLRRRDLAQRITLQIAAEARRESMLDRLLAINRDFYTEADRHLAESDLRLGLVPAIPLLVIATWISLGVPWYIKIGFTAFLLLLGAILRYDGVGRATRSQTIVLRAVVDEVVDTPSLAAVRRFTDKAPSYSVIVPRPSP